MFQASILQSKLTSDVHSILFDTFGAVKAPARGERVHKFKAPVRFGSGVDPNSGLDGSEVTLTLLAELERTAGWKMVGSVNVSGR